MESSALTILLLLHLAVFVNCDAITTQSNGGVINGRALFDMGMKYDKPLLRMMGKALMELECREHPCSQWTEWSECDEFVAQYGMKSRRRECGVNINCGPDQNPRNETEFKPCQEVASVPTAPPVKTALPVTTAPPANCPSSYTKTAEGFCLKLYKTGGNKATVVQRCKNDGGYLVNIDSDRKWNAFVTLTKQAGQTFYVHIDGQRPTATSRWTFSYGTNTVPYNRWAPINPRGYLCLFATYGAGIYDGNCHNRYASMCEII